MGFIKVGNDTRRRLNEFRARLEARLGRRVSLDEAIGHLLDNAEGPDEAIGYLLDLLDSAEGPDPDVEELAAAVAEVRRLVRPGGLTAGELTAELRRGRSQDGAGG